MTDPSDATFSAQLRPGRLRIAVAAAAGAFLIIGGVATAFASPDPAPGGSLASPANASQGGRSGFEGSGPLGGGEADFGRGGGWHHFGGFGAGSISITAIDGSNLSLKTVDGWTRTITVTSATTITKGGQTVKVSDLRVGDQIRFRQTRNSDGTYTINAIEVVVPTVGGTVSATSAGSFTLRSRDGTSWTITVIGSTAYRLGSTATAKAGARSDVTVGAEVVVQGSQTSDSALTATTVYIRLPRVVGEVTAKSGQALTLRRRDGTTLTVHVDSGTTYQVHGVTNPSLSDISVGMAVVVEGKQRADGSIDAAAVYVGRLGWNKVPFGPGWPGAPGASTTQG